MMRRLCHLLFLAALFAPASLFAHTGAGADHTHGFVHGLEHPIFGLDHLLAMLAVGLWAVQLGGRSLWAVPASFVSVMALGGALAVAGIPLPLVEPGIVGSVLLLGLLLAAAVKLPVWASAGVVGLFALFHGHAHGAEMPVQASGFLYALGFMISTAALHGVGIALGYVLKDKAREIALRTSGAAVAIAGAFLIAQSFA